MALEKFRHQLTFSKKNPLARLELFDPFHQDFPGPGLPFFNQKNFDGFSILFHRSRQFRGNHPGVVEHHHRRMTHVVRQAAEGGVLDGCPGAVEDQQAALAPLRTGFLGDQFLRKIKIEIG